MAFSRANVSGWAVGDKFTSAQANALDVDHSNALDKTIAGDALAGVVTVSTGGHIRGSNFDIAQASIGITAPSTLLVTSISGIGANATGAIQSSATAGIAAAVAGGISSEINGGIRLNGGIGDWISFTNVRRVIRVIPATDFLLAPSVSLSVFSLVPSNGWTTVSSNPPRIGSGPGTNFASGLCPQVINTGSNSANSYHCPIRAPYNGATLTQATLHFIPNTNHVGLPGAFPGFAIYRCKLDGSNLTTPSLLGSAVQYSTGVLGTYNGGTDLTLVFAGTTNNVIDTTQYFYFVLLWDEAGTNALTNNCYTSITVQYDNIANSSPA